MSASTPLDVSPESAVPEAGTPLGEAAFAARLAEARRAYALPHDLRGCAEAFARAVLALLFPHWAARPDADALANEAAHARACLLDALRPLVPDAEATARTLWAALPAVYDTLVADARALHDGDPAAESVDEVVLAYPGFLAVAVHRVAHVLYGAGVPLLPRLLAEFAHRETGIDLHPGARIGPAFAIDHGTGVVVGETAVIGARVRLFQGVTLGALCVAKDLARTRRHPTLEDDVVVYANATILGGETVVGARSVVGGNVWLTRSVPPDSVVTHRAEVRLRSEAPDLIEYHI